MKTTPKPRAVRPMKLFMRDSLCFKESYYCSKKGIQGDRPVLVIDLSPESVEALILKTAKALCASDGLDWIMQFDSMTSGSGGNDGEAYMQSEKAALSAIGTKPARVAKRKKAK